ETTGEEDVTYILRGTACKADAVVGERSTCEHGIELARQRDRERHIELIPAVDVLSTNGDLHPKLGRQVLPDAVLRDDARSPRALARRIKHPHWQVLAVRHWAPRRTSVRADRERDVRLRDIRSFAGELVFDSSSQGQRGRAACSTRGPEEA